MAGVEKYDVIAAGGLLEGFERQAVEENFASRFKASPDIARKIVGSQGPIKKGLDLAAAEAYVATLKEIGMCVMLQPAAVMELVPIESKMEQEAADEQNNEGSLLVRARPSQADTATAGSTVSAGEITEPERPSRAVYAAVAVVALLGALLWKFIAITFNYELGLVAWLVGGAIGFTAYVMGAKGQSVGLVCGVFAFLAIFGGKYLAAQSLYSSAMKEMNTELQKIYQEEKLKSESYSVVVFDESSLKRFMVDHDYVESESADDVTDEEVEEFRREEEVALKKMAEDKPGFEQWKTGVQIPLEDVSPAGIMVESLGFLDAIFVFLGVGTAFRLGKGQNS